MTDRPGIPQGLQTLLGIAASSPELRERVLADPLAVAEENLVALSESERKILKEVKPERLAQMIDRITENVAGAGVGLGTQAVEGDVEMVTLGHMPDEPEPMPMPPAPTGIRPDMPAPRTEDSSGDPAYLKAMVDRPPPTPVTGSRSDLPKKGCAALATLAALGGVGACLVSSTTVTGSRPDIPISARDGAITGIAKLDAALAASRDSRTPLIAVFYHAAPPQLPVAVAGASAGLADDITIRSSQTLCAFKSPAVISAVQTEDASVIHIDDPWIGVEGKRPSDEAAKQYETIEGPYEATLEKYGIKGNLPAVLFLAPDGTALQALICPTDEEKLVQAIKKSGGLLENWKKRRK